MLYRYTMHYCLSKASKLATFESWYLYLIVFLNGYMILVWTNCFFSMWNSGLACINVYSRLHLPHQHEAIFVLVPIFWVLSDNTVLLDHLQFVMQRFCLLFTALLSTAIVRKWVLGNIKANLKQHYLKHQADVSLYNLPTEAVGSWILRAEK